MRKRPPEIFIVGVMKGGTTILHDYICTHPRVVPGANKECHYFSLRADLPIDWYLDQFPARSEATLSIDASPTYFDTATTSAIPASIKREVSDARIILIVRDPVARAISHFQHMRAVSQKPLFADVDVNEFLSRPLDRCVRPLDPTDVLFRQVLDFSIYEEKYKNYRQVFGRENVLTLTNSELRDDPVATMRRVFAHCGLEWAPSEMFGRQDYVSGSHELPVHDETRQRLQALLYPSYRRFLEQCGLWERMTRAG